MNYGSIIDYTSCAIIGFLLRLFQDRKKIPKPDWAFQLIASVALSYLAYISYTFYKIEKWPEEFWIMGISWMGAFIVTTTDFIAKNGLLIWFRKVLQDILALTKKKEI